MPFKSEAQRRYLWANRPDIAERWSKEKGAKTKGLPYYKEGSAQPEWLDQQRADERTTGEAGKFDTAQSTQPFR